MKSIVLLLTLWVSSIHAAIWYASPSATGGDGSFSNPWSLHMALLSGLSAGDTLYLRGGTYAGPGFKSTLTGTSNNYITVRSYPGEWPVITDGLVWTLNTPLAVGTYGDITNIVLLGSQNMPDTDFWIQIGAELSYVSSKVVSNSWVLNRGFHLTNHIAGESVSIEGNYIHHTGSYVRFMGFEITSSGFRTNRLVGTDDSSDLRAGVNFLAPGQGNKAINLVIHNVGEPGIGFWNNSTGGEINGCILWGNGIYRNAYSNWWGHALYGQNITGTVSVKNNINFRNFANGLEAYGGGGLGNGFRFQGNISFDERNDIPLAAISEQSMTNNCLWTNFVMGTIRVGYGSTANLDQNVIGNVIVNGGLLIYRCLSGTLSNNTVLLPYSAGDGSPVAFDSRGAGEPTGWFWNSNAFYLPTGSSPHQFAFNTETIDAVASDSSGNLNFQNDVTNSWKDWSGFDENSTYSATWPANYQRIEALPLDYDANRWHVVVISTSGTNTAYLDLSALGFAAGQRYQVRDAQNYFTVVTSSSWDGSSLLTLPLNRTNVAALQGTITHFVNKHTNVDNPGLFNAFVLSKQEVVVNATTVNVGL